MQWLIKSKNAVNENRRVPWCVAWRTRLLYGRQFLRDAMLRGWCYCFGMRNNESCKSRSFEITSLIGWWVWKASNVPGIELLRVRSVCRQRCVSWDQRSVLFEDEHGKTLLLRLIVHSRMWFPSFSSSILQMRCIVSCYQWGKSSAQVSWIPRVQLLWHTII